MNFWKTTLITAFAFVGIGSTVLFSACEEDACLELKCRNSGSCTDGVCRCPSGYEGAECEHDVATKFVGHYYGDSKCGGEPSFLDSAYVFIIEKPNKIGLLLFRPVGEDDTLQAMINADGTSAAYDGEPNNRSVRVNLDESKQLTVTVTQTIDGTTENCTFDGTK